MDAIENTRDPVPVPEKLIRSLAPASDILVRMEVRFSKGVRKGRAGEAVFHFVPGCLESVWIATTMDFPAGRVGMGVEVIKPLEVFKEGMDEGSVVAGPVAFAGKEAASLQGTGIVS